MNRQTRSKALARWLLPMAVTAACAGAVGTAQAGHWPNFGGDAGRSGDQPVQQGVLPVTFAYAKIGATETGIRNSIVTTAGGANARFAYGTDQGSPSGRVHLQLLSNGEPVGGNEAGVAVDDGGDDGDTFSGTAAANGLRSQGVSFVETSGPGGLGQLFAVHNDDDQDGTNDIAIALIDEDQGFKSQGADFAVPGTDGFTISSSPVISGPRTDAGDRDIYFVAFRPAPDALSSDETRLFRVAVGAAATRGATFGPTTSVVVPGGNRFASPTLVNLNDAMGSPSGFVAVSTNSANTVRTFRQDDVTVPGPMSGDLGDDGQTVSVPVSPNGQLAPTSPELYVAVGQPSSGGTANANTRVFRLTNANGESTLANADSSETLGGPPAPALALSKEAGGREDKVVVTTGRNLFTLNTARLATGNRLNFTDALTPGSTGFSRTTAATSGDLAFVARDNGQQLVIRLADAQPVDAGGFTQDAGNNDSTASFGQPSISQRFVQFASDRGAFVYRAAPLTFSVNDVEVVEGNSGTRTATFTVSLSAAAPDDTSVSVRTVDGTATAGEDYTGLAATTVTFPAGSRTETVSVAVNGDTTVEPDEAFSLVLSSASGGATIADDTGVATIRNDDGDATPPAPSFSIGDVTLNEGNSGTTAFEFTITKTGEGAGSVTASTVDAGAREPEDYTALPATVVAFGSDDTTRTVTVAVKGDTALENDETFRVRLSAPTAGTTLADAEGLGAIVNDDQAAPPPAPAASIADVSIGEGDQGPRTATLTVSLDRPATAAASVDFATANGTAVAPGDYAATAGTVAFASGEQSKQVTVPVTGDTADEPDETFAVRLARPTGDVGLADAEGIVTIVDDDKPAVVVDPEPVDARGISVRVSPGRDRTAPFRFRTTGRLDPPAGVPRSEACTGRVSVQVKALNKTISTRRASLTSSCKYASRVTFKNAKRFTRSGRLKVTVRFLGNDRVNPIRAKSVNVRTR